MEKTCYVIDPLKASEPILGKKIQLHSSDSGIFPDIEEGKFIHAISNLLSNSIKFTPDDGVITTRI